MGDRHGEDGDVSERDEHAEYSQCDEYISGFARPWVSALRNCQRRHGVALDCVGASDTGDRDSIDTHWRVSQHCGPRVYAVKYQDTRDCVVVCHHDLHHCLHLMPLATKNGAIIVKDGNLAENCGCCGEWYCFVKDGGACCDGTTCSVKPECDCVGTGKVFKGVGTACTPNPCDTACKPCNGGTEPSKATVTAVVDSISRSVNSPFSTAQLKAFLEGTYTLYKTDVGLQNLIVYTFGGWPTQTGSRYADMLYVCEDSTGFGNAYYSPGTTCSISYVEPGLRLNLFCYGAQSTSRGNVCTGAQQQVFGEITSSNDRIVHGTGRMTVS